MKRHSLFFSLVIYNVATYFIYLWGTIVYEYNNIILMSILLLIYLISFSSGYFLNQAFIVEKKIIKPIGDKKLVLFFCFCSVISIVSSVYLSLSLMVHGESIKNLIMMVLTEPQVLYYRSVAMENQSTIFSQFSTLLSPLSYLSLPLGVILWKWKKLRCHHKLLLIITFLIQIISYMLKGTNFGIFVAFLSLSVALYNVNFSTKKVLCIIMVCLIPVLYFLYGIYLRVGVSSIQSSILGLDIDVHHPLFNLPQYISIPLTLGASYISQGYHGFDLVLSRDLDINLGFSRFFIEKLNLILDYDLWKETYQYKINSVWDMNVRWHTAYVWFANVFGFFGVAFFMFFCGAVFNSIVISSFEHRDLINKVLVPLLILWGLFLPANNVLFSTPYTCVAFVAIYIIRRFSVSVYLLRLSTKTVSCNVIT